MNARRVERHLRPDNPRCNEPLVRAANTELSGRLLKGMYTYLAMIAVLGLATGIFRQHPRLMWTTAVITLGGTVFRAMLTFGNKASERLGAARWRILINISVVIISGTCGYLHAAVLDLYGFESWPFVLSAMWTAALSTGGSIVFVPYMSLVWLHVLLMEFPVVLVSMRLGGVPGTTFCSTVCLFVLFLVSQARRLNTVYWSALANQALELERRRELEEISRAKSQFLANMSHEIRTPLHGILGMAELMRAPETSPEQRDFYLDALHGAANGLLNVLNDVLDFSKIEAHRVSLESISFDVRAVIEETRQILIPQARSKGLCLRCTVSPDVPSAVLGDPVRLRQVLLNLAANAVKFTEAGAVTIDARVGKAMDDSIELAFGVEDTGIGIPKEKQAAIFDAFSQADPTVTRRYGGTGLGLAISSQLVQLMGGKIQLESAPGAGSKFFFCGRFGVSAEQPAYTEPSRDIPTSPLRILLAEDNPVNQTVALRFLQRHGHSVSVVTTGRQAIEAVAHQEFDLVLMDNQMPECSGVEATRALRAGGCHVPIVGLSAAATSGDRASFMAAGMNGHLPKPFRAEELYAVVRDFGRVRPAARS